MDKYADSTLWHLLSTAREHTAGCNIQAKERIILDLEQARDYALQHNVRQDIINLIEYCLTKAHTIKLYNDRLKLDDQLCDMLNNIVGEDDEA
jgi:hypothetical protein